MRLGLDIGTNSIGWWLYKTAGVEANARITGVRRRGSHFLGRARSEIRAPREPWIAGLPALDASPP